MTAMVFGKHGEMAGDKWVCLKMLGIFLMKLPFNRDNDQQNHWV